MDTFFSRSVEFAKTMMMEHGQLSTMIVGEKPNGEKIALMGNFSDDDEKQSFLSFVTLTFLVQGVTRYLALSEAWMSSASEESKNIVRPSKDPNRIECLIAVDVTNKGAGGIIFEIKRDPQGKVSDLVQKKELGAKIKGRFTELLPPKHFKVQENMIHPVNLFMKKHSIRFH